MIDSKYYGIYQYPQMYCRIHRHGLPQYSCGKRLHGADLSGDPVTASPEGTDRRTNLFRVRA